MGIWATKNNHFKGSEWGGIRKRYVGVNKDDLSLNSGLRGEVAVWINGVTILGMSIVVWWGLGSYLRMNDGNGSHYLLKGYCYENMKLFGKIGWGVLCIFI